MKLLVLRHCKAVPADGGGTPDHERPLTARGVRTAAEIGTRMAALGLRPDRVLCSTALRTRQTWDGVAAAWPDPPAAVYDPALYLSGLGRILETLAASAEGAAALLLVGHNPDLHELVLRLAKPGRETTRAGGGFPTGTLAVLELAGDWSGIGRVREAASLTHFLPPERD